MKNNLFLVFLFFNSAIVGAQGDWRLKGFIGLSNAALLDKKGYVGGASSDVTDFYELGMRIQHKWDSKWSWEAGLSYGFGQIRTFQGTPGTNPFPGSGNFGEAPADFRLLSVPVLASYQLFDFLALQAGPMVSFQLSDFPTTKQSGLGYLIGLSLNFEREKFGLFLQPNFKRHASVSFDQSGRRLTELGFQVGIAIPIFAEE